MPAPVSETATSTEPFRRRAETVTLPTVRGEPNRVVDEVEQHLMHALPVDREGRQVGGDVIVDPDAPAGQRDVDLGDQVVDQRLQRKLLDPERDLAGFEPRQVEELIHEPPESLDLGEHHLERGRLGLLDAVEQVLEVGPDGRDRAS